MGGGGQKLSVFVHAQGIKTVHAGGGGEKWQNSVHVAVEWPLRWNKFYHGGTIWVRVCPGVQCTCRD